MLLSWNLPNSVIALGVLLLAVLLTGCERETLIAPVPDTRARATPTESRSIDLDGNGSVDFVFSYIGYQTTDYPPSATSWLLNVYARDSNQVQFAHPSGPVPMRDSVLIDETIGWADYGASLASVNWNYSRGWDSTWSGIWIGVGERSLGLRLRKTGLYHYGWVKLSVGLHDGVLTIADSGYQILPNTPILAGIRP
jgi:hypothetical protein